MFMAKNQLLEKLSNKLEVELTEERLVYILSRIRKFLEASDYPSEYSTLNFYCNLTLHSKLTKYDRFPKGASNRLRSLDSGDDYSMAFHADFHKELETFLKNYNLPNLYERYKIGNLNDILNEIWSDTPIVFIDDHGKERELRINTKGIFAIGPHENS